MDRNNYFIEVKTQQNNMIHMIRVQHRSSDVSKLDSACLQLWTHICPVFGLSGPLRDAE